MQRQISYCVTSTIMDTSTSLDNHVDGQDWQGHEIDHLHPLFNEDTAWRYKLNLDLLPPHIVWLMAKPHGHGSHCLLPGVAADLFLHYLIITSSSHVDGSQCQASGTAAELVPHYLFITLALSHSPGPRRPVFKLGTIQL